MHAYAQPVLLTPAYALSLPRIFRLEVPESVVLGSEAISSLISAPVSGAHTARPGSSCAPVHQPLRSQQASSLQPTSSFLHCPSAVSGNIEGPNYTCRRLQQFHSLSSSQACAGPASASWPCSASQHVSSSVTSSHADNLSMPMQQPPLGHMHAQTQWPMGPTVSQAAVSASYQQQPIHYSTLQHMGGTLGAAAPASLAMTTAAATGRADGTSVGTGSSIAHHTSAVQPRSAAVRCQPEQALQNPTAGQPQTVTESIQQGTAQARLRLMSEGSYAEQSFVPQALHHLAANCSSQAGGTTHLQSAAKATVCAEQTEPIDPLAQLTADTAMSISTKVPAQITAYTSSETGAAAEQTASHSSAQTRADAAAQFSVDAPGTRRGKHAASSPTSASISASLQKPPLDAQQGDQGTGSSDSTSQQHAVLMQQKQQLNAVLNSLQLPNIDSMDLSSSEDVSFGDIPSEDECDSEGCSSGTAAVSDSNESSKEVHSKADSCRDDDSKDDDDDAEYKPGGKRPSRKKPGKAKGQIGPSGARKCGRKRGNKHITLKFLEDGGYFDAPIQVCPDKWLGIFLYFANGSLPTPRLQEGSTDA